MTSEKSKGAFEEIHIPTMVVVTTIFIWCAALSVTAFNTHGEVSSLTASVADIKDTVTDVKGHTAEIPQIKAEIDFLARQRGYREETLSTSSTATAARSN